MTPTDPEDLTPIDARLDRLDGDPSRNSTKAPAADDKETTDVHAMAVLCRNEVVNLGKRVTELEARHESDARHFEERAARSEKVAIEAKRLANSAVDLAQTAKALVEEILAIVRRRMGLP